MRTERSDYLSSPDYQPSAAEVTIQRDTSESTYCVLVFPLVKIRRVKSAKESQGSRLSPQTITLNYRISNKRMADGCPGRDVITSLMYDCRTTYHTLEGAVICVHIDQTEL